MHQNINKSLDKNHFRFRSKSNFLNKKHHYVHEIMEVIVAESCKSAQLPFPKPIGCGSVLNRSVILSNVNQEGIRSDSGRCREREGECQCRLDWQTGGDVDVFIGLSTEPTEPLQGANCFHSGLNGWKEGGQRPYLPLAYSTMLTYGNNYRGHNLYILFPQTANITVSVVCEKPTVKMFQYCPPNHWEMFKWTHLDLYLDPHHPRL